MYIHVVWLNIKGNLYIHVAKVGFCFARGLSSSLALCTKLFCVQMNMQHISVWLNFTQRDLQCIHI